MLGHHLLEAAQVVVTPDEGRGQRHADSIALRRRRRGGVPFCPLSPARSDGLILGVTEPVEHPRVHSTAEHVAGWAGLVAIGAAWVAAHYNVAGTLQRLDGTWDPPALLEPVERAFLLLVGFVASLLFVTIVQVVFRRRLATRLEDVEPRHQVLVFLVPVVACLIASRHFGVMVMGPLLLLVLNLTQLARNLPPSTPAREVFGRVSRVAVAGGRQAGRVGQQTSARARRLLDERRDADPPAPF